MDNYAFERAMINHVNYNAEKKAQIREQEQKKQRKHRRQEKAAKSAVICTACFVATVFMLILFECLGWMTGWLVVVTAMVGFISGIRVGDLMRDIV